MVSAEKDPICEKKLGKSRIFMKIATMTLVVLLLMLIFMGKITAISWILIGIAIVSLAIGLAFGISYLRSAFPMQEVDQLSETP